MRRQIFYLVVFVILIAISGWYLFERNIDIPHPSPLLRGEGENAGILTGFEVPEGFALEVFARDLPGARVMAFDSAGNLWVSQTSEGKIAKLEIEDGKVVRQTTVLENLDRPHGLVIDNDILYFAEETKITRLALDGSGEGQKIVDLPKGGRHYTRTLILGPDDRLYVSIGSTCDVCGEKDERLAAIYSIEKDGSDFRKVATGLRNAVFMVVDPVSGKIFATEMGRDNLGDDLPPDEINVISPSTGSGQNPVPNFGWPICYGKNIHDTQFDRNTYIRNPCMEPFETPSFIDLPAHSAPLGLAFIPEEGHSDSEESSDSKSWPEEYWYNMLVAYHGSWNRSEPTGYKIARLKMNARGEYLGAEDFITGWLKEGGEKIGRPVDIKVLPGGVAYITDDEAGVVYRLYRK